MPGRTRARASIKLAADLVIFTIRGGELAVLLVTRMTEPFQGASALPGGFLRPDETLDEAARRELREETGIEAAGFDLRQVQVYSDLDRDPRERVVTCSYLAIAPDLPMPVADTDAASAQWTPVSAVTSGEVLLAFDHDTIMRDALQRARAMLQYTTIATAFCPPEFTISTLHQVYEIVWGVRLDRPNFYRKAVEQPGFLVATDKKITTTGRPAMLYRAGDARVLPRPILPPSSDAEADFSFF